MKIGLVLLIISLFYCCFLDAQLLSQYTYSVESNGSLEDISSGCTYLFSPGPFRDDYASNVTPIGFSFKFGMIDHTSFSVNTNGQLQLGTTRISATEALTAANRHILAILGGDNSLIGTGWIRYKVVGATPNRKLVVEFVNVRTSSNTSAPANYCNFQIWLHESSNVVKYLYGSMYNTSASNISRRIFLSGSNTSNQILSIKLENAQPVVTNGLNSMNFTANSYISALHSTENGQRRVFTFTPPSLSSPPQPANIVFPQQMQTNFNTTLGMQWSYGGGYVTGYRLYIGTDNPPSNYTNGTDVGMETQWNDSAQFDYNTQYYWKVVPYNPSGSAVECPVWSFETAAPPLIDNYPLYDSFEVSTDNGGPILHWSQTLASETSSLWWGNTSTLYNRTPRTGNVNVCLYRPANTWMTRPMDVSSGTTYIVEFWARQDKAASSNTTIGVSIGSGTAIGDFTTVVVPQTAVGNGDYQRFAGYYTADHSGVVYLGINGIVASAATTIAMVVDDINIREASLSTRLFTSQNSIDFGETEIYTPSKRMFTVTNYSAVPITINELQIDNADFCITSQHTMPLTLQPGQQIDLQLAFFPLSAGVSNGFLHITGNSIPIHIPLLGQCFDTTIQILPHSENFDTSSIPNLPLGWSRYTSSTNTANQPSVLLVGDAPFSEPNCVNILNQSSSGTSTSYLISPPLGEELTNLYVKFYARSALNSVSVDLYAMDYTPTGYQFTLIKSNSVLGYYSWFCIDVGQYAVSGSRFAFRVQNTNNTRSVFIDNVVFEFKQSAPPYAASIVYPLDQQTVPLHPLLAWRKAVEGIPATSYKVYLNQTGIFTEADLIYQGNYESMNINNDITGNEYFWKIVAYNEYGAASNSTTGRFRIALTDQLAQKFPNSTFPPASWQSTGGFSGFYYLADYSASCSLSNSYQSLLSTPSLSVQATDYLQFYAYTSGNSQAAVLEIVYSADRITWNTIGDAVLIPEAWGWRLFTVPLGMLSGGNWYLGFRVASTGISGRIYIDNIVGPMMTPALPLAVTLVSPVNNAQNIQVNSSLSWQAPTTQGGIPYGYKLYLDYLNPPATCVDTLTSLTYTPQQNLMYGTTYYWKVVAYNSAGESIQNAISSFTTREYNNVSFPYANNFTTANDAVFTQTYSGSTPKMIWSHSPTNITGGTAGEMCAEGINATGTYRLISPGLTTLGQSAFLLRFKTSWVTIGEGLNLKLQKSNNRVDWFDLGWCINSGGANLNNQDILVAVPTNSAVTYLAWVVEGDLNSLTHWVIDNLLITLTSVPESVDWQWTRLINPLTNNPYQIGSVATDAMGNSYVTGTVYEPTIFGSTTISPVGALRNFFVAKLDTNGNWLWAIKYGDGGYDMSYCIEADDSNNLVFAIPFCGTISFGGVSYNDGTATTNTLVAKLNNNGEIVWVKQIFSDYDSVTFSCAIDTQNNVYVCGSYSNNIHIDDQSLTETHNRSMGFVAKLDSSGTCEWIRSVKSSINIEVEDLAVSPTNDIYITGNYDYYINIGPFTLNSYGTIYIAKLNSNGDWSWAKQENCSDVFRKEITCDNTGNIFVACSFYNQGSVGGQPYSALGVRDILLIKYSGDGNLIWTKQIGGYDGGSTSSAGEWLDGLTTDTDNNVYLGGVAGAGAVFGNVTFREPCLFLAKYDSYGNLSWVKRVSEIGLNYTWGNQIQLDAMNNVYCCGLNGIAKLGYRPIASPLPPENLVICSNSFTNYVPLRWDPVTQTDSGINITGVQYHIYFSNDPLGMFTKIDETSITSYTHVLEPGSRKGFYKVVAVRQ